MIVARNLISLIDYLQKKKLCILLKFLTQDDFGLETGLAIQYWTKQMRLTFQNWIELMG